jgi:hypothetical protein
MTYSIIRGDKVITADRAKRQIGRIERRYGGWIAFDAEDQDLGWSGNVNDAMIAIEAEAGLRAFPCSTCGGTVTITLHHPTILDQSVDICAVCGSDQ